MTEKFSFRQMNKIIKRMDIRPNSFLVIKEDAEIVADDTRDQLFEAIARTGVANVVILIVENLEDVTVIPEEELNKNGWWRIETLRKMVDREAEKKGNANDETSH